MTYTPSKTVQSIQYSDRAIKRGERALCCSPFKLSLFEAMASQSIPLLQIVGENGLEQSYTTRSLSELATENNLLWLINVGLLRREVDGQGITDSFRLTPLGRKLVNKWQNRGGTLPKPSWLDRIYNWLNRRLRLPI
ncbi:MAG: hypothetical protein SAL07_06895 [Oscillatoria sp. PMC 1051.18]|nr:hypothetical protein [Oscillatoria sp. PMC 1050.18]MEC5029624.1 hypothetical protein [Oscillatoria sp. PMC 1051.18]